MTRIAIWSVTEIEIRKEPIESRTIVQNKGGGTRPMSMPARRERRYEVTDGNSIPTLWTTTPPIPMESCVVITRDEHGTPPLPPSPIESKKTRANCFSENFRRGCNCRATDLWCARAMTQPLPEQTPTSIYPRDVRYSAVIEAIILKTAGINF
ncbi:hypothetical protein EVAR_98023_1 [Eumeta japonica]|uniref:Uncharacterized protein n=1 Tax=Eumeta variegata TaxID=151549 RepID=A0A4C2A4A7_EUMVA|nr:hypothetical protein EVAR_98023_1 [Eumeta japonica]